MKELKKNAKLLLILIGLVILTIAMAIFNEYRDKSRYETTIKETTVAITEISKDLPTVEPVSDETTESTSNNNLSTEVIEDHDDEGNIKIENISDKLRKTVKDFSEIENKVYEVVNAYYPETTKIKYIEFNQDKEKYRYTFELTNDDTETKRTVFVFYWLKDKSVSYQHY